MFAEILRPSSAHITKRNKPSEFRIANCEFRICPGRNVDRDDKPFKVQHLGKFAIRSPKFEILIMDANIVYIAGGIVAAIILVFILRRVLRIAIKLALAGVVILALLAGAGYGWWNGWFDSQSKNPRRNAPTRTASPR
ncbi:MAG TPA: hypothetical protein VGN86_03955 [Pyrinomonadaceae bacterium]|nr:hypothetical protein [Pyrinomonadaceae bacterium]